MKSTRNFLPILAALAFVCAAPTLRAQVEFVDPTIGGVGNLYNVPAAAALKAKLLAEHDRLAKETRFRVPDYVQRPPNWGQPGSLAGIKS